MPVKAIRYSIVQLHFHSTKGHKGASKTSKSSWLCNRSNWFDDVNRLLVDYRNTSRFLFHRPRRWIDTTSSGRADSLHNWLGVKFYSCTTTSFSLRLRISSSSQFLAINSSVVAHQLIYLSKYPLHSWWQFLLGLLNQVSDLFLYRHHTSGVYFDDLVGSSRQWFCQ